MTRQFLFSINDLVELAVQKVRDKEGIEEISWKMKFDENGRLSAILVSEDLKDCE